MAAAGDTHLIDTKTTAPLGDGNSPSADDITVIVSSSGSIELGTGVNNNAISIRDNGFISISGLVSNNTNGGGGHYGTGPDTIEVRNNSRIVIESGGIVRKRGMSSNGEAINTEGWGNTIEVKKGGLVWAEHHSAAIWFQNSGAAASKNVVKNWGTITRENGVGNVIGSSNSHGIDFYNYETGVVNGDLLLNGQDNHLYLYNGSKITGKIQGGGVSDQLYLDGSGTSDFPTQVTGFRDLIKQGSGQWNVQSSLAGFTSTRVESGVLFVTPPTASTSATSIDVNGGTFRYIALSSNNFTGPLSINDANARLEGTGYIGSKTTPTVNKGIISPGMRHWTSGTIIINGDYKAEAGAQLEINTHLEDDRSATSKLSITGNVVDGSAKTMVTVLNQGGHGHDTHFGIDIIDVGGTSKNTDFALVPHYQYNGVNVVVAGEYAYYLHQNPDSATADGNFYLSAMHEGVTPTDLDGGTGSAPHPDVVGGNRPVAKLKNPAIPLYEAQPQVMLRFNRLPTMQERVGNRSWASFSGSGFAGAAGSEEALASIGDYGPRGMTSVDSFGIYTKIDGSIGKISPDKTDADVSYDHKYWRATVGVEGPLARFGACGTLVGGVRALFGRGTADVDSGHGHGEIDMDSWGLGASLTWYGGNGFYVDAQGHTNWYKTDITSGVLLGTGQIKDNDGFGYAAGIEIGKVFDLGSGWQITPQAQLYYSKIRYDDYRDAHKLDVSLDDGDSLFGRLGVAVDREFVFTSSCGSERRLHAYGIVNAYHDFRGETSVNVGKSKYSTTENRLWFGASLGGTYSWADGRYSVFAEIGARGGHKNTSNNYVLSGDVGFRINF